MAKSNKNKTRRSRFDGIDLTSLNKEIAEVTGKPMSEPIKKTKSQFETHSVDANSSIMPIKEEKDNTKRRGKGRPKSSSRKPLNTAIEPENRQRLEFLAMLNGGSVADQLNDILERYFTEVEKVDELIEIFEKRKNKQV